MKCTLQTKLIFLSNKKSFLVDFNLPVNKQAIPVYINFHPFIYIKYISINLVFQYKIKKSFKLSESYKKTVNLQ